MIAPELREIASGDTWTGTPFYGVAVVNVILVTLPAMLAMPNIAMPNNVAMVVLGFVLGMATMMALGSLLAARVSRASTDAAIGTILFFVLFSPPAFHRHRAGHRALPDRARHPVAVNVFKWR